MSATTEKTTPTAESALRVEGLSKTFTVGGMLSRRKVRALDSGFVRRMPPIVCGRSVAMSRRTESWKMT